MTTVRIHRGAAFLAGVSVLCACAAAPAAEKPDPLAETKHQRDRRMAWWREARFGMFIHWGLYAVPAGVWKGKKVPGIGEWIMARAKIPVSEYEKLVGQFNPVDFDADAWASLAKRAGMKYLVITSKHHDGFCLWDSKLTDYDIMATAFRRDVLKELSAACRKHGVRLCLYHSIMDWHHPDQKANFPAYHEHLRGQLRELLTGYGKLGVLWFDGEWIGQWDRDKGRRLAQYVRSLQPEIVINNRVGKRKSDDGDFGTPEQTIPARGLPGQDWETCMTMNGTWGFKKHDQNWKPTAELIHKLVDIASKGGNFLLNVGPTAEGTIPKPSVERLEAMGRWLDVNGESIYGTTASAFRRLPWGRCTARHGKEDTRLYLHVFHWPAGGKLTVPGLTNQVRKAYLLADPQRASLPVDRQAERLTVKLPGKAPDPVNTVVVLDVAGRPEVAAYAIAAGEDGSYRFGAAEADIHGRQLRYESNKDTLGFWMNAEDWASWQLRAGEAGTFDVELTYACDAASGGSTFTIGVGDQKIDGRVEPTASWTAFRKVALGRLKLPAGRHTLSVRAKTKPKLAVMNLRLIRLLPVK